MAKDGENKSINTILRKARLRAGRSIAEAAKHVGVAEASFSRMENGYARVTVNRLINLANFYGYSAPGLLQGEILSEPSEVDLQRINAIIVLVHQTIRSLRINPSAEKIANVVTRVYQREIDHVLGTIDTDQLFDPDRHLKDIEIAFEK